MISAICVLLVFAIAALDEFIDRNRYVLQTHEQLAGDLPLMFAVTLMEGDDVYERATVLRLPFVSSWRMNWMTREDCWHSMWVVFSSRQGWFCHWVAHRG